jgi:hypothetical protein
MKTPELYRIATMGEGRPGSGVDVTLNSSAFAHMRAAVQGLIDEGIFSPGDPTALALEMWSVAHGVAALVISKPYLPWGDVEAFADRVLAAACCGRIVVDMVDLDAPAHEAITWLKERLGDQQRR